MILQISAMVAAAGVLVGVAYYILDMRHQNKIRRTDLDLRLYSIAFSSEFQDAYRKICNLQVKDYEEYVKYGPLSSESRVWTDPMLKAFSTVISFYGLLGQLLKRKLIDMELATDWVAGSEPLTLYERIKPIIIGTRRDIETPTRSILFEYLVDELGRGAKESEIRKEAKKSLSHRREQKLQQSKT